MRMKTIMKYLQIFFFILYLEKIHGSNNHDYNMEKLKTIHSWKSLDFAYPNEAAREHAIKTGKFNEGQIIPLDVDIAYGKNNKSKMFITIPRFQKGVPVTLGVVTNKLSAKGDPIIEPYPNWEWNRRSGNCDHLTDVFRVSIDDCGRLWVLDTGKITKKHVCPPQLLVFDPWTDKLLSRYKFPLDELKKTSSFIAPIVDVVNKQNQCLDTFVYIIDVIGYQLIVYDHKHEKSWNIKDKAFNRDRVYRTITINGLNFTLKDGIFSGALSPPKTNGDKILYLHSLTSLQESWISTSVIQNSTAFIENTNLPSGSMHTFSSTRSSQSSIEAMSKDGVLFYGLLQETSLGCWNSGNHFGGDNLEILVTSSKAIQFTTGMKIRQSGRGPEELWMMTVPFAEYMNKVMNPNITNFRILSSEVNELIRGTKCHLSSHKKG